MKDITKKIKRHTTKWEKIFTIQISDKGLLCIIYKECSYNSLRRQHNKNIGQKFEQFTKEAIWMANTHIKNAQHR